MVFKEKMPSCIEWCSSARQCLGEERWHQLMGNGDKPANAEITEGQANDSQKH
jgi:hypothetical protein